MDGKILKLLICSAETVTKELQDSEDFQQLLEKEQFLPRSEILFNALCSSLTNLLCYKVSKEAYQRHAVRLHVIGVLRDLCKIKDTFENFKAFTDEKYTLKFAENLLEKHLTNDILNDSNDSESLLSLTSIFMCLAPRYPFYKSYLDRLLLRLTLLEPCDEGDQLLRYAVSRNSNLNLESTTLENIYHSQKSQLIEGPLLDSFSSTCTELSESVNADRTESKQLLNQLLEITTKSPCIFQLISAFLKELLIQLEYAPLAFNFIRSTLKLIAENCEKQDKNIIDLYPKNLQSYIILLRIDPSYHIADSKEAVLRKLEEIHAEKSDTAIILLSHFPAWLKIFGERIEQNS